MKPLPPSAAVDAHDALSAPPVSFAGAPCIRKGSAHLGLSLNPKKGYPQEIQSHTVPIRGHPSQLPVALVTVPLRFTFNGSATSEVRPRGMWNAPLLSEWDSNKRSPPESSMRGCTKEPNARRVCPTFSACWDPACQVTWNSRTSKRCLTPPRFALQQLWNAHWRHSNAAAVKSNNEGS